METLVYKFGLPFAVLTTEDLKHYSYFKQSDEGRILNLMRKVKKVIKVKSVGQYRCSNKYK